MTIHLGWGGAGREGAREDDELDGHQLHSAIGLRLIDQGLRSRGIELSVAQSLSIELTVDVVDAHGAVVGTADAAEGGCVRLGWGTLVLGGGVANGLNERVLVP